MLGVACDEDNSNLTILSNLNNNEVLLSLDEDNSNLTILSNRLEESSTISMMKIIQI